MLKSAFKSIGILATIALAGVRLAYIWKALSQTQSIDYSIKVLISTVILAIVIYIIHLFSSKKE